MAKTLSSLRSRDGTLHSDLAPLVLHPYKTLLCAPFVDGRAYYRGPAWLHCNLCVGPANSVMAHPTTAEIAHVAPCRTILITDKLVQKD